MAFSSGLPPELPPPFYAPLEVRLSQGDIVREVPWGTIVAPTTVSRLQGRPKNATVNPATEVPSAFKKGHENILARAGLSPGVVLWPNCQIDKLLNQGRPEEKWFAGVAPVLPIDSLSSLVQQSIREQYSKN